jgi:hypothetical protein
VESARPGLDASDILLFGAMAFVGMGVVLNLTFLQGSARLGLSEVAGPMVLKSIFAGLAPLVAVLAIHMVRKASPLLFISALAGGAAMYLGEAVAFRLMLPGAPN